MRIYEINDSDDRRLIGCLLYFEKEQSYIIELQEYLSEWTAPLLFANLVKNGHYTVNRELSFLWVKERVIPSGRQNIASILANAHLSTYSEIELLELSRGKCSQDSMYIKRIRELPEFVGNRLYHNLVECVPCENHSLLCFFKDETVRKVYLEDLAEEINVKKIISNEEVFDSGHIAAGGYCVTFNDSLDIQAELLYKRGIEIPLNLNDFLGFVQKNILDSSDCCSVLECSRQNLSYLGSKGVLVPIKKDVKGNLYTKGNVLGNNWGPIVYRKSTDDHENDGTTYTLDEVEKELGQI